MRKYPNREKSENNMSSEDKTIAGTSTKKKSICRFYVSHRRSKLKKEDTETLLTALIAEYHNIHDRVFKQVSQYEDNNEKTLMMVGVLLFFCITYFENESIYMTNIVDIVLFIALPIIAICSVLLGVSDLVKVMILGDYLKIIENKINLCLSTQACRFKFPRNRVMDWEYWRFNHGYAHGIAIISEISFSFIIVTLIVLTCIATAVVRLKYIYETFGNGSRYLSCLSFSIVFFFLFILTMGISVVIIKKRRSLTKANVKNDEPIYPKRARVRK